MEIGLDPMNFDRTIISFFNESINLIGKDRMSEIIQAPMNKMIFKLVGYVFKRYHKKIKLYEYLKKIKPG